MTAQKKQRPRRRMRRGALPGGGLAGVLAALALGFVAATLSARQESCLECHGEVDLAPSVHAELACSDCHSAVGDYPHPNPIPRATSAVCGDCHDASSELEASVHSSLGCSDCHGKPHELRPAREMKSPTHPFVQPATCGTCHDEPADLVRKFVSSVHGRALLKSGLLSAPSCSTCHGVHDILAVDDSASRTAHARLPETCGACHVGIITDWLEQSAHGAGWKAKSDDAPVCTTCHAAHAVLPATTREARLTSAQTCGGCHGERFSTYHDSFHGKATDLGWELAAVCSDCHTPHRNLAASDERSTVHPSRLPTTCGQCHTRVTAAFASFQPHIDPGRPEGDPRLRWVWLLMTSLLVGVFGIFGIHDALFLQRSLVAVARQKRRPYQPGELWIRRFTRTQVRVHAVVIATFLTLAATGLPLKFHAASWAHAISALLGGVETARVLHRLAALATFGYFVFHLTDLARRSLSRREKGLFWGPNSMIPRGKDFADLWANLKWFVYLGRQPRLDRWAYWEKFDYFAVFWGIAIIGGSGLLLWVPGFVSRFLPGWILNAAAIVHSDEALLATGFIFVFHFFHTHLRPESFPLDPVIFTGTMPLEKFRDERPEEYARLVSEGKLDERLVEAPSAARLRRLRLVGFSAMALGLALAAGILIALLG